MNNNVYVRSNKSILTISLTRLILMIPMIIYGFYKNGIYLYQNDYVGVLGMLKPLIFIIGGGLIGLLVNFIYEKIIMHSDDNFFSSIFSSFHIEYGVLIGMVVSINTNILVFFTILFILLMLSKFLNNRVNIMAVTILIIYVISQYTGSFAYANVYETSKHLSLSFADYLVGRGVGGIATTNILLLIVAIIGLLLTNNNKSSIFLSALITHVIIFFVFSVITHQSFPELLFANNCLFVYGLIATDPVTSCYTSKGMIIFGILLVLLTVLITPLNAVIAPFVALIIVSLLNNLLDRKANILKKQV